MTTCRLSLLCAFLAISSLEYAQTAEFHVAPNGSDSAAGTSANPFKTIRKAASVASAGDTVLVHPGTYDDASHGDRWNHISLTRSGTTSEPITFRGLRDEQGQRPLVVSPSVSAFSINSASNLVIEGFEIVPNEADPLSIADQLGQWGYTEANRRAVNAASTIDRNHIPSNIVIRDNYIHDFGDNGIGLGGCDYVLIEDNLVEHCAYLTDNGNSGISCGWFKRNDTMTPIAELGGYGLVIRRNITRYNVNLQGFKGYSYQMTDGHGIILDTLSQDTDYDRRTLIANNISYGNGGRGINVFKSDRVDLLHNTAFDNLQTTRISNPAYTVAYAADGEIGLQLANDVRMLGNLMMARGAQPTLSIQGGSNIQRSHNGHWNQDGSVPQALANADIAADPAFVDARWLNQSQAELLATMSNPFDSNSASASLRQPSSIFSLPDLSLTAASGMRDTGTSSAIGLSAPTLDQAQISRPLGAGIDIGAREFIGRAISFLIEHEAFITSQPSGSQGLTSGGAWAANGLDGGITHSFLFTTPDTN